MPTEITTWACDYCGATYPSRERAVTCEARGVCPQIPAWTILADYRVESMRILFVLGRAIGPSPKEHASAARGWIWRDVVLNDSPSIRPGQDEAPGEAAGTFLAGLVGAAPRLSGWPATPEAVQLDTSSPRYRRAWEAAEAAGERLKVWTGERATYAPAPGEKLKVGPQE